MADPPTVVYIAGYGRSGSTLLDIVLGTHQDFVGVGEIAFIWDDFDNPNRTCACGRPYPKCEFWGDLSNEIDIQRAKVLARVVERRAIRKPGIKKSLQEEYGETMRRLLAYVRTKSGASFVVDSSKTAACTAHRPIALSQFAGTKVMVIHLVRSWYSTLVSIWKRSNWAEEGHQASSFRFFRFIPGYLLANSYAARCRSVQGAGLYTKVRYRDFTNDPEGTICRIGGFLGADLSSIARKAGSGDAFVPGHNVGGNRLRFQKSFKIRKGDGG